MYLFRSHVKHVVLNTIGCDLDFFLEFQFSLFKFLSMFCFEDLPPLERWLGEKSLGRMDVFGSNSIKLEL